MKIKTRVLVQMAVLVAISIVLTRFASFRFFIGPVEGIRLGFGTFPIILGGIVFGPLAGAVIGVVADILGFMLDPMKGAFLPQFTAIAAVHGALPVLILRMLKKEKSFGFLSCMAAIGIENVLTSIILVPLVLQSAFHIPFIATIIPRIVSSVIQVPLYCGLLLILVRRLRSVFFRFAER